MINEIPSVSVQPNQMTFRGGKGNSVQQVVDATERFRHLICAANCNNIHLLRNKIQKEVINLPFIEKVKVLLRGLFIK